MKSNKIYIILFIILYTFVALVSGIHGFAFFGLANTSLLAIMLAIAFEIGQAAVLFSILTDSSQRKKVMPWVLMSILTLVQIMGNVYNSYKYLISNAGENLRFFKEPIFVWTQLPDAEANVILSYIQGAILPIVALLLTAMVSGFLAKKENEEVEYIEETEEEPIEGEEVGDIEEDEPSEEALKKFKEIESEKKNPSDDENASKINSEEVADETTEEEEQKIEEVKEEPKEEYITPKVTVSEIPEQINDKQENIQEDEEKSHFINL
jgi:hypothetical protein